ncbi:hypothetical protein O7623_02905 [Solwaraspora sp. WMMD791]|uniref:hypothetical protein n=1 Tax=Solwaraspora sp. WMMD791 TaxID=3016086 RepID=UPI00249BD5E7|nr:hypothetical protein [Solwaraspora sp. WMMD791]WFE28176.1 hypothetical protein O7623_02905 [Solwaraspora sp. WMMD791]
MTLPDGLPRGDRLYRIHWLPGTDTLRGTCHCGAERVGDDPVELWQWLLDHPRGHWPARSVPTVHRQPAGAADRGLVVG